MWIWIYYAGVFTTVPIANGCSSGEIWAAIDSAIGGQWGMLSSCWIDGWIGVWSYAAFTLQ